jgi:hypothetical protein
MGGRPLPGLADYTNNAHRLSFVGNRRARHGALVGPSGSLKEKALGGGLPLKSSIEESRLSCAWARAAPILNEVTASTSSS